MEQIINVIGPTFFAIALGYLLGRVTHTAIGPLIDVAMFVATPCLVFVSMYSSTILLGEAARIWASCLLVMAGTFVLAWLAFGFRHKGRSALYLPIIFANVINIPLPILYLAFGDEGVAQAVLFYIPYSLLLCSLGIYLASGKKGLRQGVGAVLRTPLIYAAVIGLVLNFTGVALPEAVTTSFQSRGAGRGAADAAGVGHEHRSYPVRADPPDPGGERDPDGRGVRGRDAGSVAAGLDRGAAGGRPLRGGDAQRRRGLGAVHQVQERSGTGVVDSADDHPDGVGGHTGPVVLPDLGSW